MHFLRKDIPFQWKKEQEEAVSLVKELIRNCVSLTVFDVALPPFVTTDASSYGLGAVLQQVHRDRIDTASFAARILSSAERNYSTGESRWVCEKWRVFIFYCHFTIKTDHQALVTILSTQRTGRQPMRVAGWTMGLINYDYGIHYDKGNANVTADTHSCLPTPNFSDHTETCENEEEFTCLVRKPQWIYRRSEMKKINKTLICLE